MKTIRLLVLAFLFAAVIGILLPSASADQFNKKARLTFTEPVQIGNVVLQPGRYWFKVLDVESTHNLIAITNEAGERVAVVQAVSDHRLTVRGHIKIRFWETPRGTPNNMRSSFYPGDYIGFEFVAPTYAAERRAAEEHSSVPTGR